MSLSDCLGKLSNVMQKDEVSAIRASAVRKISEGMAREAAELAAVDESLAEANKDLQEVVDAVYAELPALRPAGAAAQPNKDSFTLERLNRATDETEPVTFMDAALLNTTGVNARQVIIDKSDTAESSRDKPAFSRPATAPLRSYYSRGERPVFENTEIALVRPKRGAVSGNYAYQLFDSKMVRSSAPEADSRIGLVELDVSPDGIITGLNGLFIRPDLKTNRRRSEGLEVKGYGEKVVRAILATLPDGARLQIFGVVPNARGFWEKMGIEYDDTGRILDNGFITRGAYERQRGQIGGGSPGLVFSRGSGTATAADGRGKGRDRGRLQNDGDDAGQVSALRSVPSPASAGLSVSTLENSLRPMLKQWANAPEVVILPTMALAPQRAQDLDARQRAGGATTAPEAVFHDGRIYLFADQLGSVERAQTAVFHEALGHYGLRGTFGDALDGVLRDVANSYRGAIDAKARQYGLDPSNEDDRLHAAEEVLAEIAQERPNASFVQRAVAAIRDFLRKLGINLRLSANDIIVNYILPARDFVERGGQSAEFDGATAMASRPPSLKRQLRERGEEVMSIMDAERRLSAGDRIFIGHEMEEEAPFEIHSVAELKGYTADQMIALPRDDVAASRGKASRKNFKNLTAEEAESLSPEELDAAIEYFESTADLDARGTGRKSDADLMLDQLENLRDTAFSRIDQTQTKAFRDWFGDSKVVDADGKPLVVYHGTDKDFDTFLSSTRPKEPGIFFAVNPAIASAYTGHDPQGNFHAQNIGSVLPVYLKIENPLVVDFKGAKTGRSEAFKRAIEGGHDGVLLKNHYDAGGVQDQWAVFRPEQIKSAVGNRGTFDASNPDIRFSRPVREEGIPAGAGEIIREFTDDVRLKAHPDYRAAKAGDAAAAVRLVQALVSEKSLQAARDRFGDAVYVPVMAQEATGHNQIPNALAALYADRTGGQKASASQIVQSNAAHHTGARPLERMAARPVFDGEVQPGRYVLVDDVTTMGGTFSELADHILAGGGEVVGVVSIVNAARTGDNLSPAQSTVRQIKERFGDAIERLFRINPAALTRAEAQYVLNYKDADALGASSAAAVGERSRRLAAKGVPQGEDTGVNEPRFSRPEAVDEAGKSLQQPHSEFIGSYIGDIGAFKKYAVYPRTIASIEPDFTPVYRTAESQFETRDRYAAELGRMAEKYFDLSQEERQRVDAVLELGRLKGDVLAGKRMSMENTGQDARLSKKGDTLTLTDAEKSAYWNVRNMFNKALTMFRDQALRDFGIPVEKLGKDIRADLVAMADKAEPRQKAYLKAAIEIFDEIEAVRKGGYVPFSRWGDVVIVVRDRMGATLWTEKVETGVVERNIPGRTDLNTIPSVRRALDAVRAKFSGEQVEIKAFNVPERVSLEGDLRMADLDMLAELARVDNQQWESVRDQLAKGLQSRGFRKHLMGSANVPGYSTDFERAIADYIIGLSGYLSRRQHADQWETSIAAIDTRKPNLIAYAKKYQKYINDPQEEWHRLRQAGFLYYIAGVPASAFVNLTQVQLLSAPYLMQFAGAPRVEAELTRAYKDVSMMGSVSRGFDLFDPMRAPADVREDLQSAWDEGFFVPLETYELMGKAYNRTPTQRRLQKGIDGSISVVSIAFQGAERVNRLVTFIASHRIAKIPGVEAKVTKVLRDNPLAQGELELFTPKDFAEWVIDETHYRMGKINRPGVMRGPGTAILQFRGFTLQTLELWYRMMVQNGPEGKATAAYSLLLMLAIAGVWGMPGADDLRNLLERFYKAVVGEDMDLKTRFRELVYRLTGSPSISQMLSKGATYPLGLDLSGRIGMGNIVPDSAMQVFGIPADLLAGRPARALEAASRGHWQLAMAELLPNFIKNPMQAQDWSESGIRSQATGKVAIAAEDVTAGDVAQKAVGFTPARISNIREAQWAKKRAERAVDDLRSDYYAKLGGSIAAKIRAERAGDVDKVQKLADDIKATYKEIGERNQGKAQHEMVIIRAQTLRERVRDELAGTTSRGTKRRQARTRAQKIDEAYGLAQ